MTKWWKSMMSAFLRFWISVCCDGRRSCRRAPWRALAWECGWARASQLELAPASPRGMGSPSPPCRVLVSRLGWWWSWSLARRRVVARGCGPDRVVVPVRLLVLVLESARSGELVPIRVCRLVPLLVWWFRPCGRCGGRPRDRPHHRRNCPRIRHLRLQKRKEWQQPVKFTKIFNNSSRKYRNNRDVRLIKSRFVIILDNNF